MTTVRIGIIGAGIIGLSVARRLQQTMKAEVTVMDKESTVGTHQTGHNSNVVHSGVYYRPGSLKAELCRRGGQLLRHYCADRQLPYEEVGKVIVALSDEEIPGLLDLAGRAKANGIPGSRLLDAAQLRDREPHVQGLRALLIPGTAVVDFREIAQQLADDIRDGGAELVLGHPVVDIDRGPSEVRISTDCYERSFDHLVICAGLQSSILARLLGASPQPEIIPFRGEYYELTSEHSHLIRGLVYPVPDPRFPFLGVHFTRGLNGHVHVGPNAVLAMSQEGYRWSTVHIRDVSRMCRYPGTRRLARQHWRMGAQEILGSVSKSIFLRRARAYVPDLVRTDLVRAGADSRASAHSRRSACR